MTETGVWLSTARNPTLVRVDAALASELAEVMTTSAELTSMVADSSGTWALRFDDGVLEQRDQRGRPLRMIEVGTYAVARLGASG